MRVAPRVRFNAPVPFVGMGAFLFWELEELGELRAGRWSRPPGLPEAFVAARNDVWGRLPSLPWGTGAVTGCKARPTEEGDAPTGVQRGAADGG